MTRLVYVGRRNGQMKNLMTKVLQDLKTDRELEVYKQGMADGIRYATNLQAKAKQEAFEEMDRTMNEVYLKEQHNPDGLEFNDIQEL